MKVRPAEPRDLPALTGMFQKLCRFLEDKGQWFLNPDLKARDNGIVALLTAKMLAEGNIVLVTEDKAGEATGFLVGWIIYYPSIFQHQVVGEVQFQYPFSFAATPHLSRAFDAWARKQGATACSNYACPGHETSIKVFQRDGRRLGYLYFFKPYAAKEIAKHGKLRVLGRAT